MELGVEFEMYPEPLAESIHWIVTSDDSLDVVEVQSGERDKDFVIVDIFLNSQGKKGGICCHFMKQFRETKQNILTVSSDVTYLHRLHNE